jgi:hypothetical protein
VTQDEVRNLKKQKLELELRVKDQEEELDDMAGQVSSTQKFVIVLSLKGTVARDFYPWFFS